MLTMSNQFEMYHRHHHQQQQQQQHRQSVSNDPTMLCQSESIPIRSGTSCSGSGGNSPSTAIGKESIHSGQFMVSHFETEEDQDDDGTEIKILDLEDPQLAKPDEPNSCTDVQLYVPIKVREYGSINTIASHLEIETSLTKLFKCMNLAYSQKLTSPKWNHFKGIRLRWKDKIRLNNVIWRCWHMQFILKKRTPVCQFASPLDVDIHSNPQSVVLEGKYWKRQLTVIQAEYRKWRRNFKSNTSGCLIYDTKSEFDFFECSPLSNDRNLMLIDDWTTDTLFSAINVPFPFPDPREIARGAGNADFIQPSLGPLQPNLDDIGITFEAFLELLNSRLPPVPEEGSDDMLKNVDYGFPAIMGTNQIDSTTIMDETNQNQTMSNGDDTNMIELNSPFKVMTFAEVEESFRDDPSSSLLGNQNDLNSSMMISGNQSPDSEFSSSPKRPSIKTFPISMDSPSGQMSGFLGKSVIKGRVSKSLQRPFRREPHNYDKAQPTLHQTEIYQQMLAERQQQQQQQQIQQQALALQLQAHTNSNQSHQTAGMQLSQQYPQTMLNPSANNNNNNNNFNILPSQNILNMATNPNMKTYSVATKNNLLPNVKIEPPTLNNNVLPMYSMNDNTINDTGFHHHSTGLSNLRQMTPSVNSNSTPSFKPYPTAQTFQKSASTGNYINVRAAIAANSMSTINSMPQENTHLQQAQAQQSLTQQQHSQSLPQPLNQHTLLLSTSAITAVTSSSQPQQQQQKQQQQQQQQQQILPKEMFRSNSLPLNSSLKKLEARIEHFAVPKYQAKCSKSRSRSNSVQQQNAPTIVAGIPSSGQTLQISQIQSTTSDPMLNSTLAQLLTAPSLPPPAPNNNLTTNSNYVPSGNVAQQQHVITHQSMQSASKAVSPKKSASLPVQTPTLMMHSPPGNKVMSFPPSCSSHMPSSNISLSPESFHDQDSPLSPSHNIKYPRETQRRAGHIHAEQKRRYNIKNGFDMLHSLIPQLQQNPNAKLSKAAMLQKGAEYIKQLRSDRSALKDKMDLLRKERDNLNSSLSHLHSILPANGAPVTRQRTEHVRQLYEHYVRCRAMQNWKFWILGLILEPLLSSYTTSVSSASADELRRTVFLWVDQHCSLVDLRPAVSNKLRYLSTTTDILSDPPSTLQEEVAKAINNTPGQHPNLNGS